MDKLRTIFMILIEEFTVDPSKIEDLLAYIQEALEVLKGFKLPYLAYAKAYQCPDDKTKFRTLFEIGDRSNYKHLNETFMAYKDGELPKRFFSIVNEEDYSHSFYEEL